MENGPHGLPFSIPHQYSRKATVSSDTVAFIALFLINQLIQLGNMMRAGRGLVLRLLGVQTDHGRGLLDGLHRACTGYTAARACHEFDEVVVLLAALHSLQHCVTLYHNGLTCEADTLGSCGYVYIAIYPEQTEPQ